MFSIFWGGNLSTCNGVNVARYYPSLPLSSPQRPVNRRRLWFSPEDGAVAHRVAVIRALVCRLCGCVGYCMCGTGRVGRVCSPRRHSTTSRSLLCVWAGSYLSSTFCIYPRRTDTRGKCRAKWGRGGTSRTTPLGFLSFLPMNGDTRSPTDMSGNIENKQGKRSQHQPPAASLSHKQTDTHHRLPVSLVPMSVGSVNFWRVFCVW